MSYDVRKAFLADQVYSTDKLKLGTVLTDPNGGRWALTLKWDSKTNGVNDGYQGALFKSLDTGKYEFASRGTEPKNELYKDLLVADMQMAFKVIPDQMVSQRKFFEEAKGYISDKKGNPATDLSAVGDSLGASLVNLLGAENSGLKVDGFNTYGVGNLIPVGSYNNITNHVLARDPVSVLPGSDMIGKTYMYNEPDNPNGNTTPALSSHIERSLWQDPSVVRQSGTQVVIDVPWPGGIQGDPFTGMPWPTADDVTASGNGYNFPNTAGGGRGFVNPDSVAAPSGLGTTRNSAAYITDTNANDHLAVIKAGGTLSDLWVLQKNNVNGFADANEFYAAVLANNPSITDVNKIAAGAAIHLPEKLKDGSITYNYAGGLSVNSNPVTGEYHMIKPDGDGGTIVYSRKADEFGYTMREVHSDKSGEVTLNFTGWQETLNSEIKPVAYQWDTGEETGKVQVFANDSSITCIENKTTGDITETVRNSQQEVVESKTYDNHVARVEAAQQNALLAGIELFDAIRNKNNLGTVSAITRLVNEARIAADQPIVFAPEVGAVLGLIGALDSFGDAKTDAQKFVATARLVLSANTTYAAFNDGKGFLDAGKGFTALNIAGGIVALASLDSVLKSGNPFAIASSAMAITNSAASLGLIAESAAFGPQVMIAVAIASMLFSSLFASETKYPAPPPAGQGELGVLSDGSLGMVFKDAEGKAYQTRKLTGEVFSDSGKAIDGQNWGMGADVLSGRMQSLITDLKEQASKDGTHLILERLPSLSVHAFPSFDRNGVDNFFFGIHFKDPGTGAQQMAAAANSDVLKQFKELAAYVGVAVGATEWAQIQAKRAAGDVYATETEGQFVDRLSGPSQAERLVLKNLAQEKKEAYIDTYGVLTKAQADAQEASNRQSYSLLTLDLEGNGIVRKAQQTAGMKLEDLQADTTKGVSRFDVDNDGFMELTEWVGSKEAILGLDRNGDGVLNTAEELFSGGELSDAAENLGFGRLAFFDANKDGKLDALDPYFKSFKLWLDINGDARTGVGELYGLAETGVKSIDVGTGGVSFTDGQTIALQKTQLSADVRGVAVSGVSDGKGGVRAGQYMVHQEGKDAELNLTADASSDLSGILKLFKPNSNLSDIEKAELKALANKYGVDLSNPAALLGLGGGGNMAGGPSSTTATAADVFTISQAPNAEEIKQALRAFYSNIVRNPDAGPDLDNHVLQGQEDTNVQIKTSDLLAGLSGVTLLSVQDARRGNVSMDTQGNVLFTPLANQHGTAYFTYTAQDAQGKTSTAMVWLNLASVNDAPTANADAFSLQEDQSLSLTAAQLLANDSDADLATDQAEALRITAVDNATHGQVKLVDGQAVFTPDADYHGSASFRYTLSDAVGATSQASVQLKIDGVNDTPVLLQALPTQRVDEDQRLKVTAAALLASVKDVDTATDGQTMYVSAVTDVSHGSAQIDADGNLWFAPDANFNGSATLRYWIKDNLGASIGVWASVTVVAVNDAPLLVKALAQQALDEDKTILLTAASLLATVSDADVATNADVVKIDRVSDVSHGRASIDANGNVLYTPDANFNGNAVLRYWVTDKAGASVGVWASLKVNAINDAPVAVNDSLSVLEDSTLTLSAAQLLANDTDADMQDVAGETLRVTAVGQATHGTVRLNNGLVTFTADADWQGLASFKYTVVDAAGASSEATANVIVIGVNDAPVLTNKTDKILAKEDTLLRVEASTLLTYARDVDQAFGDLLKVTAIAGATKGVATLQADGSVLFRPNANANGDAVLTYQVTDSQGASVLVAVTINIDAVNDAPVARLDTYDQAKEDTVIRIAQSVFIGNDNDVDWSTGQMDVLRVTQISQVQGGSAYLDTDGTVVFTPTTDFNGQASMVYTLSDGKGGTSTNTLNINVVAVNDAPVLVRQLATQSINEDNKLTVSAAALLATVDDVDLRTNAQTLRVSSVGDAVNGSVQMDANGNVVFSPNANFNGNATFRYWVSDSEGASVGAWANVVVNAVNDVPYQVSTLSVQSVNEDNALMVTAAALLATVSDVDIATNAQKLRVSSVSDVSNGTATLDASGNLIYTPTANFNGTAQFRYWITDDVGASVSAWGSIRVNAVNDAPFMLRDLVVQSVNEDNTLTIAAASILANVGDVDIASNGQRLRVYNVTEATNGSARMDGSGNVIFTPNANFNGSATLRYWVTDDAGASVSALARITVNAVNDAPLVLRDLPVQSVNEDNTLTVAAAAMLATVDDADVTTNGQRLRVLSVSDASNGSVRLDANGNAVFTPTANFNGSAQFRYTVSDDAGATAWAWARIVVNAVNDAPTPMAQRFSILEDEAKTFAAHTLIANAALVDPDVQSNGDVLRISAVSMASGSAGKGSVWLDAAGNVAFSPTSNMNGQVTFSYTVADRTGASGTNTVTLDVSAVNDAPTANAASMVTSGGTEDNAKWISFSELVGNFSDVDGDSLTVRSVTSSHGGLAQISGGNVVFTPNKDFNISRDGYASFSYTIADPAGAVATATAMVPFVNTNDAPLAAYKRIADRAYEDTPLYISFSELTSGAYDADGDAVSLQSVRGLSNGSAWIDWNSRQVVFLGGSNVNGWSGFDYTLSDPSGATSTQRADVNVIAVNDNPTLARGGLYSATVAEDGLANAQGGQDPSANGQALRITLASVGAADVDSEYGFSGEVWGLNHVAAVWREGNDLLYRLEQNYNGFASFSYRVRDNQGGWADGQVNLTVTPENDRPWLIGLPGWSQHNARSAQLGGNINSRIYAIDIDSPAEHLSAGIGSQPLHGDPALNPATYEEWRGKSLSTGTLPATWDLTYTNRYGNEVSQNVSFAVDVWDAQGGWARQFVETYHQGSKASRGGKPVAIDLNGDGIKYTNLDDSKVLFDINGDGIKDLLSWTAADDGMIAFDKNGDGLIQDLDELSFLSYLTGSMTDLEGLSGFDTDKDGKLTAKDALWSKFGVWQDKNQDGVTDAGEFKGLEAWGIQSIDLKSDQMMDQVGDVYVMGKSTFERTDGSKGEIADAAFRYLDAADNSGISQPKTFNIDIESVIRKRLEDAHNNGASDAELIAMLQRFIADVANAGRKDVEVEGSSATQWTAAMYADPAYLDGAMKQQAFAA